MEEAIERLRAIPDSEQDRLAEFLLNHLDDDQRWIDSNNAHADQLAAFVAKIREDDARGELETLDPDRL